MKTFKLIDYLFVYKLFILVVFLAATTVHTAPIYNFGIYIGVLFGVGLIFVCLHRKIIKLKKIDYFLIAFVLFYCVTMLLNIESGIFRQAFVLLCCVMYFFSFLCIDAISIEKARKEFDLILVVVLVFSFIATILSLIAVYYDATNGNINSFHLAWGNKFQMKGIYSGISTCAVVTGLSAIISFYFIIKQSLKRKSVLFIAFNIINFLIQDLTLTLTYTSAGVVTFGGALFLGLIFFFIKRFGKNIIFNVIFILLSIGIIIINYNITTIVGNNYVDNISNIYNAAVTGENEITSDKGNNSQESAGEQETVIHENESTSEIFSSNGRLPIWISAISQWKDSPFFGIGYGNFYYSFEVESERGIQLIEYKNIHNGYLEVLVACGAAGFSAIMIFGGYYIFKLIYNVLKSNQYYNEIGIVIIIVYLCIYALINQLFILDRCINTFLLVTFLGMARKMNSKELEE